jgi:hypothetical protein
MGLIAKESGGGSDYTPVPEGTFQAVCNMVVDLGLQNTNFQGVAAVKHQCWVRWELPTERLELTDKQGVVTSVPMSIGKLYTLSLHEKANLRKDLEGWRGRAFTAEELKGFDLFNLAGKPCQVSVVHVRKNDRTYTNVVSVAGWPKGLERPQATETGIILYSLDQPEHYPDLPNWLKDKINARVAEPLAPPPAPPADDLDDFIPF